MSKAISAMSPLKAMTADGRMNKTVGYYLAFIALGSAKAVLGPTLPGLAERTNVGVSDISILFATVAIGGLVGSVFGGRLYDRFAGHPLIAAMLGFTMLLFASVPFISTLWLLAGVFFALGIAELTVDVGGNTLLVWVHREKVGPFMNALHFFFGVGAFLSPLIVGWLMSRGADITQAYWVIALLFLPVIVWFAILPSPTLSVASTTAEKGALNLFLIGGVSLFLFLCAGTQAAFGGWIYTYATELDLTTPAQAAYLTSAFWGALTLGRLLSIPLAARLQPMLLLFGSLAGCLLNLMLIIIFSHSLSILWIAACGLGLSMAAVFPTTLSFSGRRMTITGQITGVFLVGSGLGVMSVPWLIGQTIESSGPQSMLIILLGCIIAAGVVLTGIYLKTYTRNT